MQKNTYSNNYFSEFTHQYPVTKTLSFELVLQGGTLENMKINQVLESDELRAERYKALKVILDRYYKDFINKSLEGKNLEGLNEYEVLFFTPSKSDEEKEKLRMLQQSLRTQIAGFLTGNKLYEVIDKNHKKVISELLPTIAENDEEREVIESFKGFTTFCTGYFTIRKNLFTDEEKASSIAYRIVNENLEMFLRNKRIFETSLNPFITEELGSLSKSLLDKCCIGSASEAFTLEYFSKTMTQDGITAYNSLLGGYTDEHGVKVQGINEKINLFNQSHEGVRIAKLQPLYKQMLSDVSSLSFLPEAFETDKEVLDAIRSGWYDFIRVSGEIIALFDDIKTYNSKGIYVKSNSTSELSHNLYGKWEFIKENLHMWYQENVDTSDPSKDKYQAKRDKFFKGIDSYDLEFLTLLTGTDIAEALTAELKDKASDCNESFSRVKDLLEKGYIGKKKLIYNNVAIGKIKILLDSMKSFEKSAQIFKVKEHGVDIDAVFYGRYLEYLESFKELDNLYNKVRNYATKKRYNSEKIKLTFSRGDFLNTWDKEYNTKSGIWFEKDGNYYLGIIPAKLSAPEVQYLSDGEHDANRILIDTQKPNHMTCPRVFILSSKAATVHKLPVDSIIDVYNEKKWKTEFLQKNPERENEYWNDLRKLIDYYKLALTTHVDYRNFDYKWKATEDYENICQFFEDCLVSCYRIKKIPVNFKHLEEYSEQGKIYLFKVYNKDFSEKSHGKANLFTMYFRALFSEENSRSTVYKLNGEAEIFYRKRSIMPDEMIVHKANEPIRNKNENSEKPERVFKYDIIKDRRFTLDKFQLHIPVTMNFGASQMGSRGINEKVREYIRSTEDLHIIGINRGEKHLIYISVIDRDGNIVEQFSLNDIVYEYNKKTYRTNYNRLLDERDKERLEARQEWRAIEGIKDLKAGYLSQVVHVVTDLILKYNAIVVMEDLNDEFKRGRQKIEKQVYQNFEKALINKLNYLVDKEAEPLDPAGLYNALQLTEKFESFKKMKRQNGIIFYVPAWNTSSIDPITGFINSFYTKYESIAKSKSFWSKFDSIEYNADDDVFEFSFDYSKFTNKNEGSRNSWVACSYGNRVKIGRSPDNTKWEYKTISPTEEIKKLFVNSRLDYTANGLKDIICNVDDKAFHQSLMDLFKLILQMRNSMPGTHDDYLISPVKSDIGFFDTRDRKTFHSMPENVAANGAYNIARKGLLLIENISSANEVKAASVTVSNIDWLRYAQKMQV